VNYVEMSESLRRAQVFSQWPREPSTASAAPCRKASLSSSTMQSPYTAPLLQNLAPRFAAELSAWLVEGGELALVAVLNELRVLGPHWCGDASCATFRAWSPPVGVVGTFHVRSAWPTVVLLRGDGTRLHQVDVLDRPDLRAGLLRAFACRPRVAARPWTLAPRGHRGAVREL
jgi:hypothetical protein